MVCGTRWLTVGVSEAEQERQAAAALQADRITQQKVRDRARQANARAAAQQVSAPALNPPPGHLIPTPTAR